MDKKSSKNKKRIKEISEKHIIPSAKSEAPEEKEDLKRKWYFLLALVMLVTLASYSNGMRNQFVFDDNDLILNNPRIRGIENIPRLLGIGKWRVSYRPTRMISYAVDYTLNQKLWRSSGEYGGYDEGLNPLGYHISNCVYHLLTILLVFLVVSRLVSNNRMAFLAAALFALHPVHTDSVTYLSGRRDILFTLFYLAGFYCFLRYRQTQKILFILAAFFSFLLSLGSKEMGVTLPAIFLCYDLVTNFPEGARRINLAYFKEIFLTLKKVILKSRYLYSTIFLGALAFSYYKVFVKYPSQQSSYYGDSMLTTFLTVGKILIHYMRLMVYPINLNADYSYNAFPLSSSFLEPATFLSFIVLGITGYVVLRLMVTHRLVAFGVMWFFITLLPVCHIFPHHELLAEHYLYLPSFGFCLVTAYLLNEFLGEKRYRYYIYASFAAAVLFLSLRIVDRNRDWKDAFSLWEKTVRMTSQCARAHVNLGNAYYNKKGGLDAAISEYKQGLVIRPKYVKGHINLGEAYAKKKMFDEAIAQHKKALSIKPNYAEGHAKLGAAYLEKGMLDEAITELKKALAIKPYYAEAHANLGAAYQVKGLLDEAIKECIKAIRINPALTIAHINLAISYGKKGLLDEAISQFTNTLRTNPNSTEAYYYRGIAYEEKGMLDETISDLKKVLVFKPDHINARFKLGMVYNKKGMRDEAILQFKKAFASQIALQKPQKESIPVPEKPRQVK